MVDTPYQYEEQVISNYVFDDQSRAIKTKLQLNGNAVSLTHPLPITTADSFSVDAFGRFRVSQVETLFDSKQIHDNNPLFWDDLQTSGTGTSSVYTKAKAATVLSVTSSTTGTRTRQTFMRFNYQPGKSQLILMTFVLNSSSNNAGITRDVGYGDSNNGLFLRCNKGTKQFVRRTSTSGSPQDIPINQVDWNVDTMDGNGPSGVTLDFNKTQILIIDFEWLGVGRVRMGFVVDGKIYYAHYINNANTLSEVYISSPNLPLRYSISNDGTGIANSLTHICTSVMAEGGVQNLGVLHHIESNTLTGLTSGTPYALLGIRLNSSNPDGIIYLENVSVACSTQGDIAHWDTRLNPIVATLASSDWTNYPNSVVQSFVGKKAFTVTNGKDLDGGYLGTALPANVSVPNALRIGSSINGTSDVLTLVCTPITNNISLTASLTWREVS